MNESRQPVTREELEQALEKALERYVTKNEFAGLVQLMIDEQGRSARRHDQLLVEVARLIDTSEQRVRVEIRGAARAAAEEHRSGLGVLDGRYRDLPGRVTALELGLREHMSDAAAHGRPRRPPRRR